MCVCVCVWRFMKRLWHRKSKFLSRIFTVCMWSPLLFARKLAAAVGGETMAWTLHPDFFRIHPHTPTQTHVTATEVHPSPRPFHQYEASFFFACSWSFGGNCPRLSVERQKSSQNSKCNYWERHRLVWGDTAIWREKKKSRRSGSAI